MTFSLEVHPAAGWADAVAAELIDRLRAEPRLRICLPTGETPAPLYAALVRDSPDGLWSQATVVLLDEYLGLGPGDPAAGGPRLRRELIDAVRPSAFHTIDADDPDPPAAAARIDAIAAEGLDLALLGLGINGHVGLNEPGSTAADPTRVVTLDARSRTVATDRYGAAAAPERGITLGIGRLLESREIWLLVTGERKAAVLGETLDRPESADVPATFLRRHPRLRVLVDEPAAARLD